MKNLLTTIALVFYLSSFSQVPIYILNTSSETVEFYLVGHGTEPNLDQCENWVEIVKSLQPTENLYYETFDDIEEYEEWVTFFDILSGYDTDALFGDPIWDQVRFWSPTNGNIGGLLATSCHDPIYTYTQGSFTATWTNFSTFIIVHFDD